jgi:cytochrome c-type biogenesis protein
MEAVLQNLSQSIAENPFLAYLGVFLGGILSSSSPCVLATIPLVIGYVGATRKETGVSLSSIL